MVEELIRKIKKQVNALGEDIERIELDEDGSSIYIKILESDHIDDDFFLSGSEGTIIDSLIYIKNNEIKELAKEIDEVNYAWRLEEDTKKETDRWLKSLGL